MRRIDEEDPGGDKGNRYEDPPQKKELFIKGFRATANAAARTITVMSGQNAIMQEMKTHR
jgi:hypothetical protein